MLIMAGVEDFIDAPSEAFLEQCTRDQLIKLADHYKISVGDRRLKGNVKAIIKANLYEMEVLTPSMSPISTNLAGAVPSHDSLPDLALNFEQQKELLILRMQLEKENQLELERVRQ